MSLTQLYDQALKGGPENVVTAPHFQWIELPEEQRQYTPEAADFVRDALLGKYKRPRLGRFSPSGLGLCPRRSLFSFTGAPQAGENLDAVDLMGIGTWGHLRWQAEGLSAGWMEAAEVWTFDPHYRIGGSIDGLLSDWSLFELKTVMSSRFTSIVTVEQAPEAGHVMQTDCYAMTEGVEWSSIVYEVRDRGAFQEFRVEATDLGQRRLKQRLEMLNNHVEDNTLPPMLADCERGSGKTYHQCPYRKHCPKVKRALDEGVSAPYQAA